MPNREKLKSSLDIFIEANILLALFCLPFSKSVIEICVTLAFLAYFTKKIFIEKSTRLKIDKKILIALCLFSFFSVLSIVNSQYLNLSVRAIFSKMFKWVLLFIVVADTVKTKAQLKRVVITMALSCVLILADAAYQQYITGIDFLHYPNRYPVFKMYHRSFGGLTFPTASFPYPNDFAAWLNIYLFTFFSLTIFKFWRIKNIRFPAAGLCLLLFFFLFRTASRGGLAGAAVSFVLTLVINIRKSVFPFVALLLAMIIVFSFVPIARTYFTEEILNVGLSLDDRMYMWSTGWRIFKEHPILGNGINTFFEHFKNFRTDEESRFIRGSYAHNCFLQMASDIGVFGLMSFLAFVVFTIYSNIKRSIKDPSLFKNSFVMGLSLGIVAFLTHSFFDTNLYSLNLAALFWVSMGLVEGFGRNTHETK
jgi:O-antigen ligase